MFIRAVARGISSNLARWLAVLLMVACVSLTVALFTVAVMPVMSRHIITSVIDPKFSDVQADVDLTVVLTISIFSVLTFTWLARFLPPRMNGMLVGLQISPSKWLGSFVVLLILSIFVFLATGYDPSTRHMKAPELQAGDLMAFGGVLISVIGLYFSAVALRDLRYVINDFEVFADRLSAMIKEVEMEEHDHLRIMAYTPLPGALTLRPGRYDQLRDLITSSNLKVQVVCLSEPDFARWNARFEGKQMKGNRTVTQDDIKKSNKEVEDLLGDLRKPTNNRGKAFRIDYPVLTGSIRDLPKFSAYFTNKRALVINMLFHPFDDIPADGQPAGIKEHITEVIGFETQDTYTIRNIEETLRVVIQQLRSLPALNQPSNVMQIPGSAA